MAEITFDRVTKVFHDERRGTVFAVKDASFTIGHMEFLVLVGPSGCGKTTTLRMIAGLERQTSGDIYIDGVLVNDLHPKDRDIAMVFQDYALYPHMTVYDNMSFGLRNLRRPKAEIEAKVGEAARVLGIESLMDRKPRELSGGQRQRVALGRAIVRNPKVFLFDEPLSNLDAKLRMQMRVELAELHERLQGTIVYVTHDQIEAMTLGHRIVVMNHGIIQQMAPPDELYERPANLFVAQFIGAPTMNTANAVYDGDSVRLEGFEFKVPEHRKASLSAHTGKSVIFGVRPEDIHDPEVTNRFTMANSLRVHIKVVEYLGSEKLVYFDMQGRTWTAKVPAGSHICSGADQTFVLDMARAHLFDPETEAAI